MKLLSEPRPANEGIKTFAACGIVFTTVSEPRPANEGIKTHFQVVHLGIQYRSEPRPANEGIKTHAAHRLRGGCLGRPPDYERICYIGLCRANSDKFVIPPL